MASIDDDRVEIWKFKNVVESFTSDNIGDVAKSLCMFEQSVKRKIETNDRYKFIKLAEGALGSIRRACIFHIKDPFIQHLEILIDKNAFKCKIKNCEVSVLPRYNPGEIEFWNIRLRLKRCTSRFERNKILRNICQNRDVTDNDDIKKVVQFLKYELRKSCFFCNDVTKKCDCLMK